MLRRKEDKTMVSEVGLWLMKKGHPYQRYDNLSDYLKGVLRNLVCIPTRPTTARERAELYEKLCLPIAGRTAANLVPPDEELKKYFTPLAPSEVLSYFEKF